MSVIRVGSSGGYAAGWEAIFGGGRKAKATAGKAKVVKKAVRPARPAKSAKKRAAAKKARRRSR